VAYFFGPPCIGPNFLIRTALAAVIGNEAEIPFSVRHCVSVFHRIRYKPKKKN